MIELNTNQPSAYDLVFPVFGGKINKDGNFEPVNIFGTAFYLNNDFFLTCCHTIKNASSIGQIAIGYKNESGAVDFAIVNDFEEFETNDSGILHAHIPRAKAYNWLHQKLAMLNKTISIWYPYWFDSEKYEISIRAFKGYISLVWYNHDYFRSPHYELSYPIPRGLSGGPLIYMYKDVWLICGMTIGNKITDMIVDSVKEEDYNGGKTTVYERTESLHMWIAMQTSSFYNIRSRLLKWTFLEYLTKNNMLK